MSSRIATVPGGAWWQAVTAGDLRARHLAALWAVSAGLVLFAATLAATGYFIVDEVAYLAAADAFRTGGVLTLTDGYPFGRSPDLTLTNILKLGPHGVVSQYPSGSAVAWALPVELFGPRGVLIFNAACLGAALFGVRALALTLLGCERRAVWAVVLVLAGTYVLDYAFAIWPHSVSLATVVWGLVFFLRAIAGEARAFAPAVVSGLLIGLGMTFRVDNILILPAILAMTTLWAARPFVVLAGGGLGLMPGVSFLALTNQAKFGTLNPLSYGATGQGGGIDPTTYMGLGLVLGVAFLGLLALRLRAGRGLPRAVPVVLVMAVVVAALAMAPFRAGIGAVLWGAWLLLIDARAIPYPEHMVERLPGGAVLYANLAKKAVAQSAPWLGVLAVLAVPMARARKGEGRALAVCLICASLWMLPFLIRNWHGGMGLNMRYLLPILPCLAIAGAIAITAVLDRAGPRGRRALPTAAAFGALAAALWCLMGPDGVLGMGQMLSLWAFGACLAAAVALAVRPVARVAVVAVWTTGAALGVAASNAAIDTGLSQMIRAHLAPLSDLQTAFPGRVVVYGLTLRSALIDPGQMVAARYDADSAPDAAFLDAALDGGYRVLMEPGSAALLLAAHEGFVSGGPVAGPIETVEIFRAPPR